MCLFTVNFKICTFLLAIISLPQASPLSTPATMQGNPSELSSSQAWPRAPFEYHGHSQPPYVLYVNELEKYAAHERETEGLRLIANLNRALSSLHDVSNPLSILSDNFRILFEPFSRDTATHDASICAEQFWSAQQQYGARDAYALCHKGNTITGAIRFFQRPSSETILPWPRPPFSNHALAHGQRLVFSRVGSYVDKYAMTQFGGLLRATRAKLQASAHKPATSIMSSKPVRLISVSTSSHQFEVRWDADLDGDDVICAFYAFVNAQSRYRKRCVEARWQDSKGQNLGAFTIKPLHREA